LRSSSDNRRHRFRLGVAAEVAGREAAEAIQLHVEYDPAPPFAASHPRSAPPELVAKMRERLHVRFAERRAELERLMTA
jgi:cyclohexyl-isocyanide hydratase